MEKKTITRVLLEKSKSVGRFTETDRYTWGEINQFIKEAKITMQDTDILTVGFVEGWDHGDSSRDDCYDLTIERVELESDESFNKRKEYVENSIRQSEQLEYQKYLKLKEKYETPLS